MKKKITFSNALLIAIGSVIGSGIFFKSDDILRYSQGNVISAILGWVALGGTLIFAGIAVAILAARTERHGGIGAYIEDAFGARAGFAVNWFFSVLYAPTQIGIIAWVAVMFGLQLVNTNSEEIGVTNFYLLVFATLVILFGWNLLSTKFSALFSSFSTITKLIPLILLSALAFIGLSPANMDNLTSGISSVANNPLAIDIINSSGDSAYIADPNWLKIFAAPLLAMAFTFDGWHTVGSLSIDMENPKRDLAKVFALNAVIITVIYTVYFSAINIFMPADQIILLGDEHLQVITHDVFGAIGGDMFGLFMSKAILVILVISCLGSCNGATIGGIRYIQAMGEEGTIPFCNDFKQFNARTGTALKAGIAAFVLTVLWLFVYYAQEAFGWFDGIIIDELPIAMTACIFIPTLIASILIFIKERKMVFKTLIAPLIGILGQAFILFAFFLNNANAVLYAVVCIVFVIVGLIVRHIVQKNTKVNS